MKETNLFVSDIPRRAFLEMGFKGAVAVAATPLLMERLLAASGPADLRPAALPVERPLLDKVIRKALEQGGDYADVYVENRTSRNLLMEESRLKTAEFAISQGAGVRVILGDRTGYAYTDEISEERLLRAAEVASYIARGGAKTKPVDVREAKRESYVTVKLPLDQVADEKRLDVMRRAHQAALDYDKRIRMASISYYARSGAASSPRARGSTSPTSFPCSSSSSRRSAPRGTRATWDASA